MIAGGRFPTVAAVKVVTSVATMQRLAQRWHRQTARVALVPTMGALHRGHLSLVRRARRVVGPAGRIVVSIYVNPTQFGPTEDFAKYPRDLKRDLALCRREGVDAVFAPGDREMYPPVAGAPFSTCVAEESLARRMEGRSRPAHFRGVTTIVAKLFNLMRPEVAVFGAKDFQQAAIIQRMVRDLNFPVKIIVAPTVREPDGLALSSRNRYLAGDLRTQATALWRAIRQARTAVRHSARPIPAARLRARLRQAIEAQPAARVDYLEFFAPDTLAPVAQVTRGTHLALAVVVGGTRLIDNAAL